MASGRRLGHRKIFNGSGQRPEINRRLIRKFSGKRPKRDSQARSSAIFRMPITANAFIKTGSTGTCHRRADHCIDAVRNTAETTYQCFCEAVRSRTPFHRTVDFRGYDGSWVEPCDKDDGYHRVGTWPQDSPKSTADAVTVITTCLSTNRPSLAAL